MVRHLVTEQLGELKDGKLLREDIKDGELLAEARPG